MICSLRCLGCDIGRLTPGNKWTCQSSIDHIPRLRMFYVVHKQFHQSSILLILEHYMSIPKIRRHPNYIASWHLILNGIERAVYGPSAEHFTLKKDAKNRRFRDQQSIDKDPGYHSPHMATHAITELTTQGSKK